jgi:hypothetical protein
MGYLIGVLGEHFLNFSNRDGGMNVLDKEEEFNKTDTNLGVKIDGIEADIEHLILKNILAKVLVEFTHEDIKVNNTLGVSFGGVLLSKSLFEFGLEESHNMWTNVFLLLK